MKTIINVSILTTLLLIGCKASDNFSGSESVLVKKLKTSYQDNVTFQLLNVSTEKVQIESTEQFYIERSIDGDWNRIPFIPCMCGTPCRPPVSEKMASGEMIEINWNLISRKCNRAPEKSNVANFEEKVSAGDYRMVFNVNREKDGMRITPEKLVVNFSVD